MANVQRIEGRMSTFGGPNDQGVKPTEGLAIVERKELEGLAHLRGLFLPEQPEGTSGLARQLDPEKFYVACRWDYSQSPKSYLQRTQVAVYSPQRPERKIQAQPIDWGPNENTGRAIDLSPGLADALNLKTDDRCVVELPLPDDR